MTDPVGGVFAALLVQLDIGADSVPVLAVRDVTEPLEGVVLRRAHHPPEGRGILRSQRTGVLHGGLREGVRLSPHAVRA